MASKTTKDTADWPNIEYANLRHSLTQLEGVITRPTVQPRGHNLREVFTELSKAEAMKAVEADLERVALSPLNKPSPEVNRLDDAGIKAAGLLRAKLVLLLASKGTPDNNYHDVEEALKAYVRVVTPDHPFLKADAEDIRREQEMRRAARMAKLSRKPDYNVDELPDLDEVDDGDDAEEGEAEEGDSQDGNSKEDEENEVEGHTHESDGSETLDGSDTSMEDA